MAELISPANILAALASSAESAIRNILPLGLKDANTLLSNVVAPSEATTFVSAHTIAPPSKHVPIAIVMCHSLAGGPGSPLSFSLAGIHRWESTTVVIHRNVQK